MIPQSHHIYRVDKFNVPKTSRDEFLAKVNETHQILRDMPGFLQDFILEQDLDPNFCSILTFVEWENQESVENAKVKVGDRQKEKGFNPKEVFTKLNIKADMGTYSQI